MAGADENNFFNSATGVQNHARSYRPPFAQQRQVEMELSPILLRGSAQEEECARKRYNPWKRSERKVLHSNDETYDIRKPAITAGSRDTLDLSFENTPFRRRCMGLWEQLDNAMRQRERAIEEKELEIAHNLSILRERSEAISSERIYLEKLRQESEFLRRRALEQTKKLEEKIAELKNLQHLHGNELVREVVDQEESEQVDKCKGLALSRRKISGSVDSQLNELLARESITNHVTDSSSVKTCNLLSNDQGVAAVADKEPQSRTESKISLETPPSPQKTRPLVKVEAVPTDEYFRPYQQCLGEDGKLMLTALPEIRVFSNIDPSLNGNELRIVKTECEEEMPENLEDVPLKKRRQLLRSKASRNKTSEGEDLNSSRKASPGSNKEATNKQFATFSPSAAADCFTAEAKKRTVSMDIALQEDAPELLEALRENGLYKDLQTIGIVWENDSEELNHRTENLEELEGVISKLWGSCSGLFKEGRNRLHITQAGNRPSYSLPCLISLIEKTKVFRQRKWPVEWGWCRQLCAFLFVFEKHNRIVLERPEYGFATYFFELVQELPVKWQVQRIIKVMSATNNCRAALVENRPLQVGVDLIEEEAAILEKYGWIPNSGIGSLLNFCERVSHDYKSDELVDWRSKIGKLLMDGHDHGRIMPRIPPIFHFMEYADLSCEDKCIVTAETTCVNGHIDAIIKEEL